MYSHDTFGLGHIRRTLLIAEHITNSFPDVSTLILTGSSMIHDMRIPPNVDYIKVPCLTKHSNSCYQPKFLTRSPDHVRKVRQEIITNTIREFSPDALLVDKVPMGAVGELLPSLHRLKDHPRRTRVILGLRDILDDRNQVRAEWTKGGVFEVLETCYDDIWVYGMKDMFDVVEEYGLSPSIAEKVHYCGYLKRGGELADPEEIKRRLGISGGRLVLMVLGGGGDGNGLVRIFMDAVRELSRAEDIRGLIVTGPDFPKDEMGLLRREDTNGSMIVKDYTSDILDFMNAADLVVSMSGYNTICEILSLNKKSIVIPRVTPRKEQLIRASLFSGRGLLTMIHPDELTADALKVEMLRVLSSRSRSIHPFEQVDFNGLEAISERFEIIRQWMALGSSLPAPSDRRFLQEVSGPDLRRKSR